MGQVCRRAAAAERARIAEAEAARVAEEEARVAALAAAAAAVERAAAEAVQWNNERRNTAAEAAERRFGQRPAA